MEKTENVLAELKTLVNTPGYIYPLFMILFDDFHIPLEKAHEINYRERISIKEASLLLGFLIQNEIDFSLPTSWENLFEMKNKTYDLLAELHSSLMAPFMEGFKEIVSKKNDHKESKFDEFEFFGKGSRMVEPIFYSGDGVYDIQYLEFLELKYKYDKKWLYEKRSFDVDESKEIIHEIKAILQKKAQAVNLYNLKERFQETVDEIYAKEPKLSKEEIEKQTREILPLMELHQYVNLFFNDIKNKKDFDLRNVKEDGWKSFCRGLLNLFTIKISDFKNPDKVKRMINNFSVVPGKNSNPTFKKVGDYNVINSHPLIFFEEDTYFVPLAFLISQAVYESPFYWMNQDKGYIETAGSNRGKIGEELAYDFLSKVFGKERTFKSVKILSGKGKEDTDIDIFCILGSRALCVQVKSKRLTEISRKGDDVALINDFKGAVQDAYEQGLISRKSILENKSKFLDENGKEIKIPGGIEEVYIMGITTENYPALTHQSHIMLKKEEESPFPLILTIFDLDLLAHYIPDPYDFMYYINQRIGLMEYFKSDEEMNFLGLHLTEKLWKREDVDQELVDSSMGQIIDRNYYPYKLGIYISDEGDAIKNKWKNESFENLCYELKKINDPKIVDIMFNLFDLSSETREHLVNFIKESKEKTLKDNKFHNFSMPPGEDSPGMAGFTYFSWNSNEIEKLRERLFTLCQLRKYKSKGNVWIGLGCLKDSPNMIDLVFYVKDAWKHDEELEKLSKEILDGIGKGTFVNLKKKVGRNEKCPCGSGLKYKKCCLKV